MFAKYVVVLINYQHPADKHTQTHEITLTLRWQNISTLYAHLLLLTNLTN